MRTRPSNGLRYRLTVDDAAESIAGRNLFERRARIGDRDESAARGIADPRDADPFEEMRLEDVGLERAS